VSSASLFPCKIVPKGVIIAADGAWEKSAFAVLNFADTVLLIFPVTTSPNLTFVESAFLLNF
jgi:hypothetical protein